MGAGTKSRYDKALADSLPKPQRASLEPHSEKSEPGANRFARSSQQSQTNQSLTVHCTRRPVPVAVTTTTQTALARQMSNKKIAVIMDPIESIKVAKDTSLALMLAAQRRGWSLYYLQQHEISMLNGEPAAQMSAVKVDDNPSSWYQLEAPYFLQRAADQGTLVVNNPRALRDINEKMFTAWFPDFCPPTLVCSSEQLLRDFHKQHGDIIVKPLDGMGGASIFRLRADDPNISVVIETMTRFGSRQIMAQRYLPEIVDGDKRVLVIDGKPLDVALARIPAAGETRGNLAAGGNGVAVPLSEKNIAVASEIGAELRERGVLFAGLDMIGDYITEINVTSPTCARELDAQCGLDIGSLLMDALAKRMD